MEKIPLSVNLQEILPTRFAPVAIVDDQGHILGHYIPRLTADDLEPEGGWPSDEELEALAKNPGKTYTTDEVIAHLRSLG